MKDQRILAAIDFSPISTDVLEQTLGLAKRLETGVLLLHATSIPVDPYGITDMTAAGDADQARLQSYAEILRREGVEVECRNVVGEPGRGILEAIDVEQPHITVVGTHGRTGLDRLVMGSVAEFVIRRARRPLLVVPPPENAPKALHGTA